LTLYALDSQLARAQAELGSLRSQVAVLAQQRVLRVQLLGLLAQRRRCAGSAGGKSDDEKESGECSWGCPPGDGVPPHEAGT
jgi:hypothetical protein